MKPIICNSESVRAILDGRKTQTRRVIKPQLSMVQEITNTYDNVWEFYGDNPTQQFGEVYMNDWVEEIKCPYGIPGDKLWVRETWNYAQWNYNEYGDKEYRPVDFYHKDGHIEPGFDVLYKADKPKNIYPEKWRSPIYMPKKYSRITLEINDVRVERVQDINWRNCIAEGIPECPAASERWKFMDLWNSINAKKGYGWEMNPFVWIIEFEKCSS